MRRTRYPLPARITLALAVVLTTTAWNLIRLWSSLALSDVLERYAPQPGPVYIAITGGVSAALGLAILLGFWLRVGWASWLLLGGAYAYAAWVWLDRELIQTGLRPGWQLPALITGMLLAFITAVSLDPRNRFYFGKEAHEREKQDRPAA